MSEHALSRKVGRETFKVLNRMKLLIVIAGLLSFGSAQAADILLAGWTMPTAIPNSPVPTGTSYLPPGPNGPGGADTGVNVIGSQLKAEHLLLATAYSSPSGNGSTYSFSSNNWSPGDYYQASVSTTGYSGISVSWDQARSSTGPVAFQLMMSVDSGQNFTSASAYNVTQTGGAGAPGTWGSINYLSAYTLLVNLPASADNLGTLILRFQNAEVSASNPVGSNRIDNVQIFGSVVPEPSTMILGTFGAAFALALARRRSRSA